MQPTTESRRIETLDVVRGFALLGILLLNILGFGLHSAAYSNPGFDLATATPDLNLFVWAGIELTAEGAMRCLFSMLFGAGIVLFTTGGRAKSGVLHYKRTLWLLAFGLLDAYVLLWNGDILTTYALAGAFLYLLRNVRPSRLIGTAAVLIVLMSLSYAGMAVALGQARDAAHTVAAASDPVAVDANTAALAEQWHAFSADYLPSESEVEAELAQRRSSYSSAFAWNAEKTSYMLTFVLPVLLFWDALAMMLLGMALFKNGVLTGERSRLFYVRLMAVGFGIGLLCNGFEMSRALRNDFDLLSVFAQMQPTYHVGRLGMALGYLALLVILVQRGAAPRVRRLLANVGRLALTNYLMQSVLCGLVFSGAGLALVGHLDRSALYLVVAAIWAVQVGYSDWWLRRYRFGPVEWLWRALTYGERPPFSRA